MGTLTTICAGRREDGTTYPCGKVLKVQEGVVREDILSHGVCADCYVLIMGVPPNWRGQEEEYTTVCRSILKHGVSPS